MKDFDAILSPIRLGATRGDLLVAVAEDALVVLVDNDTQSVTIIVRAHRLPTASGAFRLLALVAAEFLSWLGTTDDGAVARLRALEEYASLLVVAANAARRAEDAAFAAARGAGEGP